jgi:hypothetical protein
VLHVVCWRRVGRRGCRPLESEEPRPARIGAGPLVRDAHIEERIARQGACRLARRGCPGLAAAATSDELRPQELAVCVLLLGLRPVTARLLLLLLLLRTSAVEVRGTARGCTVAHEPAHRRSRVSDIAR